MKKIIALSVSVLLLYSCATVDNKGVSSKGSYKNLASRLKMIEQKIEENRVNIHNNSIRLDRLDTRLLIIQKRIAKEAMDDSLANYIPPASKIDSDDKKQEKVNENYVKPKPKKTGPYDGIVNIFDSSQDTQKKEERKPKKEIHKTSVDKELYKAALKLYNHNDFKGSEHLFEDFIKNHQDSRYIDNAMFWLAYSYLHLNKVKKGVDMLKELVDKYPNNSIELGGKTDAALYTLVRLYKNNPKEREKYKKILFKRFPKSKYTKLLKK